MHDLTKHYRERVDCTPPKRQRLYRLRAEVVKSIDAFLEALRSYSDEEDEEEL
jgi:hypothetical protein